MSKITSLDFNKVRDLSAYKFHAETFIENDGSITISLDEIDLVENDVDEDKALSKMAHAILEYSNDYYKDFAYWARGDRKSHIPFVFKSLLLNDVLRIGGLIECRPGRKEGEHG